jgi:hypothetical protein
MERLMCLHVQTSGEPVEVSVNGLPVLSLPAGPGSQSVTVHEFLQNGSNRISLVVAPPPLALAMAMPNAPAQPRMASRPAQARARLVLLRKGKSLADEAVRVLAEVNWAVEEGAAFEAPTAVHQDLELPVGFRRWRWLDAPVLNLGPLERQTVLAFVQRIAFELSRGNPDAWLTASRLKHEEMGQAYQRPDGEVEALLREEVQQLWKAGALATLRLLECLNPMGAPVLSTQNDGVKLGNVAWALRLTLIEGKVYILR